MEDHVERGAVTPQAQGRVDVPLATPVSRSRTGTQYSRRKRALIASGRKRLAEYRKARAAVAAAVSPRSLSSLDSRPSLAAVSPRPHAASGSADRAPAASTPVSAGLDNDDDDDDDVGVGEPQPVDAPYSAPRLSDRFHRPVSDETMATPAERTAAVSQSVPPRHGVHHRQHGGDRTAEADRRGGEARATAGIAGTPVVRLSFGTAPAPRGADTGVNGTYSGTDSASVGELRRQLQLANAEIDAQAEVIRRLRRESQAHSAGGVAETHAATGPGPDEGTQAGILASTVTSTTLPSVPSPTRGDAFTSRPSAAPTRAQAANVTAAATAGWASLCDGIKSCQQSTELLATQMATAFRTWRRMEEEDGVGALRGSSHAAARGVLRQGVGGLQQRLQALADATASIGPPVDLSQFGVQVPQWLPTSALNAIVAHETAAERRDTRQLLADHLRLEGKLETYKRQVRALTRDLALVRRDGGGGSGVAAHNSAARARSNSGAGLRSRVKHLQDLLEEKNGLIRTLREALTNATTSTAQLRRDCSELQQMKATLIDRMSAQSQRALDLTHRHQEMCKVVDRVSSENAELRKALQQRESRIKQLVDYQIAFETRGPKAAAQYSLEAGATSATAPPAASPRPPGVPVKVEGSGGSGGGTAAQGSRKAAAGAAGRPGADSSAAVAADGTGAVEETSAVPLDAVDRDSADGAGGASVDAADGAGGASVDAADGAGGASVDAADGAGGVPVDAADGAGGVLVDAADVADAGTADGVAESGAGAAEAGDGSDAAMADSAGASSAAREAQSGSGPPPETDMGAKVEEADVVEGSGHGLEAAVSTEVLVAERERLSALLDAEHAQRVHESDQQRQRINELEQELMALATQLHARAGAAAAAGISDVSQVGLGRGGGRVGGVLGIAGQQTPDVQPVKQAAQGSFWGSVVNFVWSIAVEDDDVPVQQQRL